MFIRGVLNNSLLLPYFNLAEKLAIYNISWAFFVYTSVLFWESYLMSSILGEFFNHELESYIKEKLSIVIQINTAPSCHAFSCPLPIRGHGLRRDMLDHELWYSPSNMMIIALPSSIILYSSACSYFSV